MIFEFFDEVIKLIVNVFCDICVFDVVGEKEFCFIVFEVVVDVYDIIVDELFVSENDNDDELFYLV